MNATTCFRSTDCDDNHKYCQNRGKTQKATCNTCGEDKLYIDSRSCNCGDAKHCSTCNAAGDKCEMCNKDHI